MDRVYWPVTATSLFLALCGYLAVRLRLLDFGPSFLLMVLGLLVAWLAALAALARILKLKARHKPIEPQLGLAVVVGILPALIVVGSLGRAGMGTPLIHDITTDTANPPEFVLALQERKEGENPASYEGEDVANQQKAAYPHLHTLHLKADPTKVARAIRVYISRQGWRLLVANTARPNHIEAVATSRIMGFRDDIVFRLTPVADGVLVDIRSASRVGSGDLGANAKRIEKALQHLRQQFPAESVHSVQQGA